MQQQQHWCHEGRSIAQSPQPTPIIGGRDLCRRRVAIGRGVATTSISGCFSRDVIAGLLTQ